MNALLIVVGIVLSLPILGAVYQRIATRRDKRRFPPPGAMVNLGDHHLHLHVMGDSHRGPTVILEAGMASMSSNWGWVQPAIARLTRVVAYDRAGLGWSEPGAKPLDAARSARELYAALQQARIAEPYVLVGHSYGGLVVRVFADLFPNEVVGMVLVDASHPDQWANIPASKGGQTVATANRITAFLARFGLLRLLKLEESYIAGLPAQSYAEMKAYLATPTGWLVGADGLDAWRDLSRQQVNDTRGLGDLPLYVLSVTEQDLYADVLTRLQAELPKLSPNSLHTTVQGATHYTLVSKPEYAAVVTQAIVQVLEAAQTGVPLTQAKDRELALQESTS